MKPTKSLSFFNLILIIVMTVYSFSSMSSSFFMMGLKSFPWFLISAFFYFIPYALIVSEYTRSYSNRTGGIYDWLKDAFHRVSRSLPPSCGTAATSRGSSASS